MTNKELTQWLRNNSSGIYRPAALAADVIEELEKKCACFSSGFRVSVQRMIESHRTTYWVCIDRPDRPVDAKPWEEGRMTHYYSESVERANEEGQAWAEFLGGSFKPYIVK